MLVIKPAVQYNTSVTYHMPVAIYCPLAYYIVQTLYKCNKTKIIVV